MAQRKSRKKQLLIVLVLVIIGGILYLVFQESDNYIPENITSSHASLTPYSKELKNINKVIKIYESNIEVYSQLLTLESYVDFPLQIGLIGKENPFALPTQPLELLFETIQGIE